MLNVCEAMMSVGGLYCQSVSQEMFNIIFIIYSIPTNPDIEHHALCMDIIFYFLYYIYFTKYFIDIQV